MSTEEPGPEITGDGAGDVAMVESADLAPPSDAVDNVNGTKESHVEVEIAETRTSFSTYLTSPVVTLIVGSGDDGPTVITAHQALLTQSPYFRAICDAFEDRESVSPPSMRVPIAR